MRRMYYFVSLDAVPADADIVAYPVAGYEGSFTDHPNTIFVPVDWTGGYWASAVVLGYTAGGVSVSGAVDWVRGWYRYHPDGFSSHNGTFFKPVILADESKVEALRAQIAPSECDWWVHSPGSVTEPYPMAFARTAHHVDYQPGEYAISYVYDDTWGYAPEPMWPGPVTAKKQVSALAGVVIWLRDGDLMSSSVMSYDLGETWR